MFLFNYRYLFANFENQIYINSLFMEKNRGDNAYSKYII